MWHNYWLTAVFVLLKNPFKNVNENSSILVITNCYSSVLSFWRNKGDLFPSLVSTNLGNVVLFLDSMIFFSTAAFPQTVFKSNGQSLVVIKILRLITSISPFRTSSLLEATFCMHLGKPFFLLCTHFWCKKDHGVMQDLDRRQSSSAVQMPYSLKHTNGFHWVIC